MEFEVEVDEMGLRGDLVHRLHVHRRLVVEAGVLPDERDVHRGEVLVGVEGVEVALQETAALHEDHRLALPVETLLGQREGVVGPHEFDAGHAARGNVDEGRLHERMDGPDAGYFAADARRHGGGWSAAKVTFPVEDR